jgi:hypothetical protein
LFDIFQIIKLRIYNDERYQELEEVEKKVHKCMNAVADYVLATTA